MCRCQFAQVPCSQRKETMINVRWIIQLSSMMTHDYWWDELSMVKGDWNWGLSPTMGDIVLAQFFWKHLEPCCQKKGQKTLAFSMSTTAATFIDHWFRRHHGVFFTVKLHVNWATAKNLCWLIVSYHIEKWLGAIHIWWLTLWYIGLGSERSLTIGL